MRGFIMLFALTLAMAQSGSADTNPIEVGAVQWGRDLDRAQQLSAETGRPVFVLFQEVPG